mgnify:FL=1
MSVRVIPAPPDIAPQRIADLLWSTDPALNGFIFGSMDVLHRILQSEWPATRGMLCHRHAFLAEDHGAISGLLVGHTAAEFPANFEAALELQTQALLEAEALHLREALKWMDRLFPAAREGTYYILELAVAPDAQGVGVAHKLLAAAQVRALGAGCTHLCLDVAADNEAVAFYQHIGFVTEIETRMPYLADTYGIGLHYHMTRPLEPASCA